MLLTPSGRKSPVAKKLELNFSMAWRPEFFVEGPGGPELVVDMNNRVGIYIITGGGFEYEYIKAYVGQTVNLRRRRSAYLTAYNNWVKAGRPDDKKVLVHPKLFRAFDAHGIENFRMLVAVVGIPPKWLSWAECSFIKELDSYLNGLNCTLGGQHTPFESLETFEKLLNNEEWRANTARAQRKKGAEWKKKIGRAGADRLRERTGAKAKRETPVRDKKTGLCYRRVTSAARLARTSTATIHNHLSGRTTLHHRWEAMTEEEVAAQEVWADDEEFMKLARARVPVVHLKTMGAYPSMAAGAEAAGTTATNVLSHCDGKRTRKPPEWMYRDVKDARWSAARGNKPTGWPDVGHESLDIPHLKESWYILDTWNGRYYATAREAAEDADVHPITVGRALNDKKTGRWQKVRRAPADIGASEPPKRRGRPKYDGPLKTREGRRFASVESAAALLDIPEKLVRVRLYKKQYRWMEK